MRDILIIGGFNWLGFELTKMFIERDLFSNIIIVDVMNNFLLKDNQIKQHFDKYAHLYGENIFLHNVNIKDKNELNKIYKHHNIECVVNNVKFNCHLTTDEKTNLLHGYANIVNLNESYSVRKYVYLTRSYTHEKLFFNRPNDENFLEENFIFNESAFLVNENKGTLINIPDYIFGNKCHDSNNFFCKLVNIMKIKSPVYIPRCSTFCLCDDLLLMFISESLFTDIDDKHINEAINENISGPHRYIDIFNHFESSVNNRIVLEKVDKHSHPGMMPHDISESSLLGKYLQSLNLTMSGY